jgi:hypothetical protein
LIFDVINKNKTLLLENKNKFNATIAFFIKKGRNEIFKRG